MEEVRKQISVTDMSYKIKIKRFSLRNKMLEEEITTPSFLQAFEYNIETCRPQV
jgi:hypothetical protein